MITDNAADRDRRRWLALATISIATLMVVLDASIVNIALPQAQHDLGISEVNRHWAVTGYAVTFGGLLLLGGRAADYIGRRRMLDIGLSGFAAASVVGGLATGTLVFIVARAVQGVFAAVLAPAALSLLTITFTNPRERARAFGVFAAVQGAGGAIGLIAGGLLTQYLNWRWCLLVNLPIAAVAVAGALYSTAHSAARRPRDLDLLGAWLATSGSVGLVVGFTFAGEKAKGWTSPLVVGVLGISVVLLTAFVVWQRRARAPMLPMRILASRNRAGALATSLLVGTGMFGMFLFLAFYLQDELGLSPVESGLAFLPFCVGIVAVPVLVAPRLSAYGPRPPMAVGMAVAALGMFWLTAIDGSSSAMGGTVMPLILMGTGLGLVFAPMNTAALSGIDSADAGVASALVNATQQLGGALGVALLNSIYTVANARQRTQARSGAVGDFDGYRLVFTMTGVLFVLAFICVLAVMRTPPPEHDLAITPSDSAQSEV